MQAANALFIGGCIVGFFQLGSSSSVLPYKGVFVLPFTEGQRTLFLPSNDALSKVPADELKVYQKNVTALKGAFQSIFFTHV